MSPTHRRRRRASRPRRTVLLSLEGLEPRCLLSTSAAPVDDTLDQARGLDALGVHAPGDPLQSLGVHGHATGGGVIGDTPAGGADVDWYHFRLSNTARVHLTTQTWEIGSPLVATLSLYNDAPVTLTNPDDLTSPPIDPYTPIGHRMLAQDDPLGHGGGAPVIDRLLGAGDYWVAVSGAGNDYFHPFLADSGLAGSTGAYLLSVTTSDPGLTSAGPVVLAADPAPNAVLSSSPFLLRFDLDRPINPATVTTDPTLRNPVAQLFSLGADGTGPPVRQGLTTPGLGTAALQPNANELILPLQAPLAPAYYRVVLKGYGDGGTDYVLNFHVTGNEGNPGPNAPPDDTVNTAHDLGDVADGRLRHVSGAIGLDSSPTAPVPFDPAGVSMYHFRVTGSGQFALTAEVFAGRIGSPLDAALTLFRAVPDPHAPPVTQPPILVASNDNTFNTTPAGRFTPLYTDPALFVSLTPGDYYLAVSSGENINTPDPSNPPYPSGVGFDPLTSHTGNPSAFAINTGPYVLELLVQPAGPAPHVVPGSVAPDTGPGGGGPLTAIRVQFDQPVNLLPLSFAAFQQTGNADGTLSAVSLKDAHGTPYALRLESFDDATNTATFILLDAVPAGSYTLRLSVAGPQGITNLGGARLVGNDPSGDFVAQFSVSGTHGDTFSWATQAGHNDPAHAQAIGVLFPVELSQGVAFTRDAALGGSATEDDYGIQLLQTRLYSFNITGPTGLTMSLIDATGTVVASYTNDPTNPPLPFSLAAGTYTLRVSWSGAPPAYTVTIGLSASPENPTPLVIGPGPAVRVRLLTNAPDPASSPAVTAPAAAASTGGGPVVALPGGASAAPAAVVPAGASSGLLPLPGAFTFPSSALLVQAFSPLGGVASAGGDGPSGGGVLVRGPADAPVPGELFLRVLIVTQAPLDDGTDAGPTSPQAGAPGAEARAAEAVTRLLDAVFEFWGWFRVPARPPVAPPPPPPVEDGGSEDGDPEAALPDTGADAPTAAGEAPWGWAGALAAAALLAPERGRRARRRERGRVGAVDGAVPGAR